MTDDDNYQNLKIEDGDLISIKKSHGIFGWLTKFFTGKYTHTGIAVLIENKLWMVEINGGRNHAIPLNQYGDKDYDVSYPPIGLNRAKIREAALESLNVMTNYGFIATIATGVNEFFGFNKFIHWRKIRHCAGYAVSIYEKAGWEEHSYIISPTKLTELLIFKLSITNKV